MAGKDFGVPSPGRFFPIDKERARAIANEFERMSTFDPKALPSYNALARETLAQYQAARNAGLKVTPVDAAGYPYGANPREVALDVGDRNHMAFFKTDPDVGAFGSGPEAANVARNHPLLQPSGEYVGGHPMLNNDLFRVVHDYFGHVKNGYGFRGAGEDNAWRSHAAMYSPEARPAMTNETRGQNSWVNYGPHGDANRTASAENTIYAPQKVGIMPAWTMDDLRKWLLAGAAPVGAGTAVGAAASGPREPIAGFAEGGPIDDELIPPPRNPAMPADWAQRGVMGVANTLGNIVSRPRRAMEEGITSEEAVPWAGEVASTMAGVGGLGATSGALGAAGGKLVQPLISETGLAVKGPQYSKASRAALDEIAAGPKGAGPIDLTTEAKFPAPQVPLERYVPPRGVSPRLQDALKNENVLKGISESIEEGRRLGADKWYHTGPLRQAWIDQYGPVQGPKNFAQYMDMVAATSPRSDVQTNIRNASYYYGHALKDAPLPKELPYPYGHVAQNLHRQNFETLTGPRPAGLSADAPENLSRWDVLQNPKPASFSANLQGNLEPGTIDTHAFRNLAMRTGDPRFLETSITQLYKPGVDRSLDSMVSKYGEIQKGKGGKDKVIFRPQKLVKDGKLTMDEAQSIPSFWASKPNDNEYAAVESLFRELGKKVGMPTADAQAAAWSGAGKMTGLGSSPSHTFPQMFNERVLYTAKMRGEDPHETLGKMITGKAPLLGVPAAVGVGQAVGSSRRPPPQEGDSMNQGGRALATARSIRRGFAEGGDVDPWQAGVDAANRAGTMRLSPVDTGPSDSLMGIGRAGDTLRKNAPLLADTGPGRIAQAIGRVVTGQTPIPPHGMRREDYTDDPNAPQPIEPLVNDAMNVADVMSMGSLPAVAMRGAQRGALGVGVPPKEPFRIQPQDIRAPKAANVNTSKAEVLADLPLPLPPSDRIWQNYVKRMGPDEMLKSEPVWSTAENLSAAKGISPSEAFAEVANDMFGRMGANRFMTPAQAKMHMARERGVLVPVPAEGLTMKRPISGFAAGGSPDFKIHPSYIARAQSRSLGHTGPINSMVPGRTDHHAMSVPAKSYVVPADIASGLGQGNTAAGMKVLGAMFPKSGPYGSPAAAMHRGTGIPRPPRADGGPADGGDQDVPIYAAGGEFVVHPDDVADAGGGDHKHGYAAMDAWVKAERAELIKTLRNLPGPAKD
jgi:hypothetical protein